MKASSCSFEFEKCTSILYFGLEFFQIIYPNLRLFGQMIVK